jgi:hypothetical protein
VFIVCLRVCLLYFSRANDGQWMVPTMANDAKPLQTIETNKVKIKMCKFKHLPVHYLFTKVQIKMCELKQQTNNQTKTKLQKRVSHNAGCSQ